jgi:hypothetical protein
VTEVNRILRCRDDSGYSRGILLRDCMDGEALKTVNSEG